ncbi:MAG: sensor histidine kinase [Pseudonocardia sp.]
MATPAALRRSWDQRLVEFPVPALIGAGIALVVLGLAGPLLGEIGPTPVSPAMTVTMAAAFTPFAVFVTRRLPGHPLGRLMLLIGMSASVAAVAVSWSALLPAAWLSQWVWWVPLALIPILLLLTPDGRLPSPRWRPLAAVLLVAASVGAAAVAAAAVARPRTLLSALEETLPPVAQLLLVVATIAGATVLLATIGVFAALIVRWRRAEPLQRRQLACLLPSVVLFALGVTLDVTISVPYTWLVAVAALPLGLTFAVLRYQLHDLDLYVHRGTVWFVLTGLAVATYAIVVTALSGTVVQAGSPVASLLAAGAVAALLYPAQQLVQRGVSRLLYGRRDEPYAVITELGQHLGSVRDPLAVLPQIAATIVESLRVPYAAVRLAADDGESSTVAERGRWSGPPERFQMMAHGEPVGELLVAPRRPGTRFSDMETLLLSDLAGQAALAAEACRSAVALQRARDRLVLAREEERRRLRRDLHDGVASALVGTRMLAEVARRSVPADGPAPQLLETLAADLDTCTAEVRELIDGLRPAALDDGLEKALHALVDRFSGQGPKISLTVDGELAELPAALEVVAYRVVTEALTNVVKHARAQTVTLLVRRDERYLDVQISDDGVGFDASPDRPGVGLQSIRSRAEELGGQSDIRSDPSGTTVELILPLIS